MNSLGLDARRPAPIMPLGPGLAFAEEFLLHFHNDISILAMGRDDHAEFFREAHRVIQLFVGEVERALVGEENLEAADALLDDLGKLVFAFLVETRDRLVKREIARGILFRSAQPELETIGQRLLVARLANHFDHGRRAANERRFAGRLVRVLRKRAHEWQEDVDVWIDKSGENVFARCVDYGAFWWRLQIRADAGDLFAFAIDVRRVLLAGGDDPTILNEE